MERYASFSAGGEIAARPGLDAWVPGGEVGLTWPTAPVLVNGTSGDDVIDGSPLGDRLLSGDGGSDRITAGDGNDEVELNNLDRGDFADGGAGYDWLDLDARNAGEFDPVTLSGGQVFLDGVLVATGFEAFDIKAGDADDTLIRGPAWDYLYGGEGDDLIETGAGGGSAYGEWGNDTLKGGEANDLLDGGLGSDLITAGAGNDSVALDDIDAGDFADGGTGFDQFYLDLDPPGPTGPILMSNGDVFLGDVLVATGFEQFLIWSGSGDDRLVGGPDWDELWGGDGDDVIDLGGGGWKGAGEAHGEGGNDTLIDGGSYGSLQGGDGNDVLDTGEGGGSAYGGAGDDVLRGGGGSDLLTGDLGSDRITAGGADDLVLLWYLDAGDFADGGEGPDRLEAVASDATAPITASNGQVFFDGLLVATGFEELSITSGSGKDTLIGGAENDSFSSGGGNDLLDAGEESDYLSGGAGKDTLLGGSGDDRLLGGKGKDELTGGAGADFFDFLLHEGRRPVTDVVTDFEVGLDRLWLAFGLRITSIETVRLDGGMERDTLVHLSNGNSIGLLGVHGVTADDLI